MIRLACVSAFVLFLLAPAAAADGGGPDPGVVQGWTGVGLPSGPFRYVTMPTANATVVAVVRRSTGRVWNFRSLGGTWCVLMVAGDGTAGGLSRDGRLLVLAEWKPPKTYGALRPSSRFVLLSTKSLRVWRRVTLTGDFTFDALSPDGRILYLIQHVSSSDVTSYRVRAYDVAARRLLPRVIADRRQSSWVMHGSPVTRAAGCTRSTSSRADSRSSTPSTPSLERRSASASPGAAPRTSSRRRGSSSTRRRDSSR